ncbi:hypothetical protein QC763_0002830 [Podospora pseudopauciseta]|uniref:Uncharacterized protein n=1 Tax=Podospora pseudopauciseta TaxID=2093780 RepID=A0ABR0HX33_9PEZI|nr:hypothetical protein QC763_0002830 [Podospora pseudopauciseta]
MSRSYSLSKFPNIPTTQDSHQEMVVCHAAAWTLQRTVAEGSPAPIGLNQRFPRVTSDGKPCRQGVVLLPHHYCGNIPLASRLLNSPASQRHDETLTLETFWQLRSVLPCYPSASLKWVLTLTALLPSQLPPATNDTSGWIAQNFSTVPVICAFSRIIKVLFGGGGGDGGSSNRCKRHSDISCIDFELGTPTCPPIPDFHKLKLAGHITTNRLHSTGTPTPQAPSKPPTAGLVLVDPAAPATSPSVEKTPRSAQRPDTATLPRFQAIYRLLDCCCALCLLSVRLIDLIARTEAELATPDCQAIDNCPDNIPLLTPVSCVL